jgi:hypothetical protein
MDFRRRDVAQKKDPSGPDSDLIDPTKSIGYSIVVNAPGKVDANGWGLSLITCCLPLLRVWQRFF